MKARDITLYEAQTNVLRFTEADADLPTTFNVADSRRKPLYAFPGATTTLNGTTLEVTVPAQTANHPAFYTVNNYFGNIRWVAAPEDPRVDVGGLKFDVATQEELNAVASAKADAAAVSTALAAKADTTAVNTALAGKADTTALAAKADTTALAAKADVTALDTKANAQKATNTQVGAYTLALGDAGNVVELDAATAAAVTVPANATVPFPIGTVVTLRQYGLGNLTVAAAAGVTIRSAGGALRLSGQFAEATLTKRGTDEWVLAGNIVV